MRGPRWGYWLSSALPRDLSAAAVATRDFFFRPFKGRLSLIILRIYKILSSAYANDTYVHPASDKCAICANAPVEVRCPLRFWRHSLTATITCSWWRRSQWWRQRSPVSRRIVLFLASISTFLTPIWPIQVLSYLLALLATFVKFARLIINLEQKKVKL